MLFAHLVPGYFAAELSQPYWNPQWGVGHRVVLWGVAFGSSVLPDSDVVYNVAFRGFINHSTLWTHSVFVYGIFAILGLGLYLAHRWQFLQFILGLTALGGFAHILLDVVSHGTPSFYPVSMMFVTLAPRRVMVGGFWAYITDPIFLLEPLLISFTLVYIVWHLRISRVLRIFGVGVITTAWLALSIIFIVSIPALQTYALPKMFP